MTKIIKPNWPAPKNIVAFTTTRQCELGKDTPMLPAEPIWLNQVHGNKIVDANKCEKLVDADGLITFQKNTVCAIKTADCLPILITNKTGDFIAALHGGWRGLAQNIIYNAIKKINCDPNEILVWLGPAIGPDAFEVGQEVFDQFLDFEHAFVKREDKWLANIVEIARAQLNACGVVNVYSSDYCTYSNPDLFYSYRRDGKTGRMASLIWM